VIAPTAARADLTSRSRKKNCFALTQHIQWIRREPSCVTQLRKDRQARSAVTNCDVSIVVHRGTSHPAPGSVRLVRALLIDSHGIIRHVSQLKPTYDSQDTLTHD